MRRDLLLAAMLVMLVAASCGDDDDAAADPVPVSTDTSAADSGSVVTTPVAVDFQAMGESFVDAAAAGDCETAANLSGWSTDSQNRETSIANCQLVTAELTELGRPAASSTREETQDDGDVTVWVTRHYPDGSQWELMMVIKLSTAANRDDGWVVSTYSY